MQNSHVSWEVIVVSVEGIEGELLSAIHLTLRASIFAHAL